MSRNMNLKKLIETADLSAEAIFRATGQLLPMYHMITVKGAHIVTPSPSQDKDLAVKIMKAALKEFNVDSYVFLSEAWSVSAKTEDIAVPREGLRRHPDRREIIMYSAEDRAGNQRMAHRYILRPEHGPATLSRLEIMAAANMSSGRLVGLFK